MDDNIKAFCNEILRYGEIVLDRETEFNGTFIRLYNIIYEGVKYECVKQNGVWIHLEKIS